MISENAQTYITVECHLGQRSVVLDSVFWRLPGGNSFIVRYHLLLSINENVSIV